MAEKGIIVDDGTLGDIVATRDAVSTDEAGFPRTIQIVDFASRKASFIAMREGISSDDPSDIESMSGNIFSNMRTVGDRHLFTAMVDHSVADGSVNITPVVANKVLTTFSIQSSVSNDDGEASAGSLDWTSSQPKVGDFSTELFKAWLKFQLPTEIVGGATIISANLVLSVPYRPPSDLNVWLDHATDSNLIISSANMFNESYWDGASSFYNVSTSGFQEIIDVTSTVQSLVDAVYYTTSSAFPFRLNANSPDPSQYMTFYSYDGPPVYRPTLEISVEVDVYSFLETKTTAMGDVTFNSDGGTKYKSPMLAWDLLGSEKVSAHISGLSAGNTVTVYGSVI